jgi:nucleotide-binding universal stress UspA family protein
MEKVLVPVDGSAVSERALPVAERLASALGAEVVLVTVVPADTRLTSGSAATREDLNALAERLSCAASTRMEQGNPVAGIHKAVAEEGASFVVMSSHGHSGFRGLPIGRVAMDVIGSCKVPVVVVGLTVE